MKQLKFKVHSHNVGLNVVILISNYCHPLTIRIVSPSTIAGIVLELKLISIGSLAYHSPSSIPFFPFPRHVMTSVLNLKPDKREILTDMTFKKLSKASKLMN